MSRLACLIALALATAAAASELPDPTRPPEVAEVSVDDSTDESAGGPVLSSIVISPERRIAVIDGAAVRVGERAAGGRIVSIETSHVVLEDEIGEFSLSIAGSAVKSDPVEER